MGGANALDAVAPEPTSIQGIGVIDAAGRRLGRLRFGARRQAEGAHRAAASKSGREREVDRRPANESWPRAYFERRGICAIRIDCHIRIVRVRLSDDHVRSIRAQNAFYSLGRSATYVHNLDVQVIALGRIDDSVAVSSRNRHRCGIRGIKQWLGRAVQTDIVGDSASGGDGDRGRA